MSRPRSAKTFSIVSSARKDDGDMNEVLKRYATDDDFREVANILFGAGAEEVIAKANPDGFDLKSSRRKGERRQAQVGLASNVLGLAAGAVGTKDAWGSYKKERQNAGKSHIPKHRAIKGGRLADIKAKHALPLAGAALGLQAANMGGDAVANRVLARESKKPKTNMIHKNLTPISKDIAEMKENASFPSKKNLTVAAVTSAGRAAGKGAEYTRTAKGKLAKLPSKVETKRVRKSAELDVVWEGEFSKVNADKQQVFGWASIVEVNGEPVVDLQGDYISIDEVEKSAYSYVVKSRKGGDMHLRDGDQPVHASDMIESFVVTDEKKKALGLPD